MMALDLGAAEFVRKPTSLATERVKDIRDELVRKVKAVALLERGRLAGLLSDSVDAPVGSGAELDPGAAASVQLPGRAIRLGGERAESRFDAVVLGLSTGGPQALRRIIPHLPADLPIAMAVVVHMPVGYTQALAEKLNDSSAVEVLEAREDLAMVPGRVLLARGGRHLKLERHRGEVVARLDLKPFEEPHRPSVDVLFKSAADMYGERLLAVVMTGMGNDGTAGSAWVKAAGGTVYAESEQTAMIYGMPRSVVEAGLADRVLPLDRMGAAIAAG
jgi:two-component system chemotaxis response regulator CheB